MEDSGHTYEWTGPKVERTVSNRHRIYITVRAWMVEQARRPDVSVASLALRQGVNAIFAALNEARALARPGACAVTGHDRGENDMPRGSHGDEGLSVLGDGGDRIGPLMR